ncbi:type IV secretory system conjugative DNA transfer family protein [Gynuella sunshinyii]|uniref:Putative ATPase n=1 Tax=Gynuella sunshinyii YC6258 TaxID=1445510 RepID=A0A0C5UYA3_9GAMM|nr:type IV secretory system conjugative DNA transfer family protein [Gynuella sunshinyii]AJQ92240.1 putative ATPase [Gynuella sunshinyii YC6258]AJQ95813.1 putative ATPase [Gynuella sunshinyii YC6258]
MSRINENLTEDIRGYFGATGSGKTYRIKKDLGSAPRVLVYDIKGTFGPSNGFEAFTDRGAFLNAVRSSNQARYSFHDPSCHYFDWFCELARHQADARRMTEIVIDELGPVSTPGKAQGHWHWLISIGRTYGIKIKAGAQRPSEIDKTLMGNLNGMFVGRVQRDKDAAYLSAETGIPQMDILNLRGAPHYEHFLWAGRGRYKKAGK